MKLRRKACLGFRTPGFRVYKRLLSRMQLVHGWERKSTGEIYTRYRADWNLESLILIGQDIKDSGVYVSSDNVQFIISHNLENSGPSPQTCLNCPVSTSYANPRTFVSFCKNSHDLIFSTSTLILSSSPILTKC